MEATVLTRPESPAPARLSPESTKMFLEAGQASTVAATQLAANARKIEVLAERLRANPPRVVVTCARGSSDHAATFARYLIETKAGAAGAVGAQFAASARPDGYTLLIHIVSLSGFAEVDKLFGRQPKFTRADFIPIARFTDCSAFC